ncbi:MAG TPA: endonuclease/exonuclease/phosphatase family protein [Actinomycetota bacterium]|nr:endonuclease/exonuclease/phosphatase family protein [Actinomycetota bacterium]
MTLRVATFNIRHGLGIDKRLDLDRTASVVRTTGAGLIALQEVDRGLPRSNRVDQAAALGDATGMHATFAPTLRRAGGEYGIALLTDVPVEATVEPLPRVEREEPRVVVVCSWHGVTIVATHLAQRGEARAAHTTALARRAAALGAGGAPVVVLGDLNQGPRTLGGLRAAGFAGGPRRATFSRRRAIDHILAGPGVRLEETWTIRSDVSDHLPLVADLIIDGPQPRPARDSGF